MPRKTSRLRALQSALFAGVVASQWAKAHRKGAPLEDLLTTGGASVERCVRLHREMFHARMEEALSSQYPHLRTALGERAFTRAVRGFISQVPPRGHSLRDVGEGFPDYLSRGVSGRDRWSAWHADLAKLEWARFQVFDAPDQVVLTPDHLEGVSEAAFFSLQIQLCAAHRLVSSEHDVGAVWDTPHALVTRTPTTFLVWRSGVQVFHRAVESGEHAALVKAQSGSDVLTLAEMAAQCASPEVAAARLHQWLSNWLTDGLLTFPGP